MGEVKGTLFSLSNLYGKGLFYGICKKRCGNDKEVMERGNGIRIERINFENR